MALAKEGLPSEPHKLDLQIVSSSVGRCDSALHSAIRTGVLSLTAGGLAMGTILLIVDRASMQPTVQSKDIIPTIVEIKSTPTPRKFEEIHRRSEARAAATEVVVKDRIEQYQAGLIPSAMDVTPVPTKKPSTDENLSSMVDGVSSRPRVTTTTNGVPVIDIPSSVVPTATPRPEDLIAPQVDGISPRR